MERNSLLIASLNFSERWCRSVAFIEAYSRHMKVTNNKKKKKRIKESPMGRRSKIGVPFITKFSCFQKVVLQEIERNPILQNCSESYFFTFFFLSDVTWMCNSQVRNKIRVERRRVNEWRS